VTAGLVKVFSALMIGFGPARFLFPPIVPSVFPPCHTLRGFRFGEGIPDFSPVLDRISVTDLSRSGTFSPENLSFSLFRGHTHVNNFSCSQGTNPLLGSLAFRSYFLGPVILRSFILLIVSSDVLTPPVEVSQDES